MPYPAGSPAARPGEVVGTLRLLAYLALSVTLVLLDHRGGWLSQARAQADLLVQPLWTVAGWPGRAVRTLHDSAGTRSQLIADNARLRNELLVGSARLARLQAAAAENARLRGLLGAVARSGMDVQLAPVLDIDLDPSRQRLVLDAGGNDGVRIGQAILDAGGLVGQVIEVDPGHAIALLLTDPDHAVPVVVERSGVRLVAYGSGRSDQLSVTNIPLSADVRVGDALVTSGLGRRFPAGFPVGRILALRPDHSRAFLVGDVRPAAQLDRGRDVLLLRSVPAPPAAEGAGREGTQPGTSGAPPVSGAGRQDASAAAPEGAAALPTPPTPAGNARPGQSGPGRPEAVPEPPPPEQPR